MARRQARRAGGEDTPKLVDAASPNAPSSTDPRLVDLRRRYAGHTAATHSVWTPEHLVAELTLERFREDNACVCQTRVNNRFIG
jgi:hypothetical protein